MRCFALLAMVVLAITCGPSPDAKLPGYVPPTGGAKAGATGSTTDTGGTTVGTGGVPGAGGSKVVGTGGSTVVGSGGRFGTGGATGTGGRGATGGNFGNGGRVGADGGPGGVIGTGGRRDAGGIPPGTGGAIVGSDGSGSGGAMKNDAGRGGSDGGFGTGGNMGNRDAAIPPGDGSSNCLSPVVSNGYTCGSTPACSACVINGTSQEAACKKGLDCLEQAGGASCTSNCQLTCLNSAGDAQIQKCITALMTAACSGTGC